MINSVFFEYGITAQTDAGFYAYPSSLVVLPDGRLMAAFIWRERFEDQARYNCCGTYSNDGGISWSKPEVLFDNNCTFDVPLDELQNFADTSVSVNGNCVLLICVSLRCDPERLDLSRTRMWQRVSFDSGLTWSPIREMQKYKMYVSGMPHPGLNLMDGSLILGYSWDRSAEDGNPSQGEGGQDYHAGILRSIDGGKTWTPGKDVYVYVKPEEKGQVYAISGADEPAVVELEDGTLYMLVRTGTNRLWESKSMDKGKTWTEAIPSQLVSHNCPAALLKLHNGEILVVYNDHPVERARLCARISCDSCLTWSKPKVFAPLGFTEEPEASYPAVCQLDDGTIVVVWGQTQRSDANGCFVIYYARFNRDWVMAD